MATILLGPAPSELPPVEFLRCAGETVLCHLCHICHICHVLVLPCLGDKSIRCAGEATQLLVLTQSLSPFTLARLG